MNVFKKEILDQIWVVGVSGGSDSMALLDMCYQAHIQVIVAHMNYQLRDSATRDMNLVQTYCKERTIPCYVKLQSEQCHENFQAFARDKRYAFYREVIEQHHAKGVMIAHQKDDVIETYIMQDKRNSIPEYYGIKEMTMIMQCFVLRPLLEYTKKQLQEYCLHHNVPYGDDESNFSRKYTRNKIRMDVMQHMSEQEKQHIIQDIQQKNKKKQQFEDEVYQFYHVWDGSVEQLKTQTLQQQVAIIDKLIFEKEQMHTSKKELLHILSVCDKSNFQRIIGTSILQVSYGMLKMVEQPKSYHYVISKVEYIKTPYFELRSHGNTIEAITLQESDFPLTIRNVKPDDKIRLRFGEKRIHRWFIDRKIAMHERKMWPVVENAQGNIIFVPKIGCDIEHFSNNPSLFVIK